MNQVHASEAIGANGRLGAEEATLVEKIVGGPDMQAFEVVVQRYSGMVLATCRRVMDSASDAEDATQETFLKLLQQASTIRQHLGAWLHQCAVRTCIDMRRRIKTQAKHIRQASATAASDAKRQVTAREMMAEVDEALLELDEASRDLILKRYLLGRTLKEIADASGVSEGTMSRRVEKATEALREIMTKRGVMAGGFGGAAASMAPMTTMLEACGPVAVDPVMQGSLMKLGLSAGGPVGGGVSGASNAATQASSASSTSFWSGGTFIGIAAGIAVLTGAAMIYNLSSGSAGGSILDAAIAPTAGITVAPARPTKELDPLDLAQSWGETGGRSFLQIAGDRVRMSQPMNVGDDVVVFDGQVMSSRQEGNATRASVKLLEIRVGQDTWLSEVVGQEVEARFSVRHGRLLMAVKLPTNAADVKDRSKWQEMRVHATRMETPGADQTKRRRFAETPPGGTASALAALGGWWSQVEEWQLVLSDRDIVVKVPSVDLYRFRILDWQIEGDVAKVQTICTRSVFQQMPGQRVKMLLQVKGDRLMLAVNNTDGKRLNEWPVGFDASKDAGLTVYSWGKDVVQK